jgi:hypothetical protein
MATWRDTASAQAQRDLDDLLNTALGFAQQQLTTRGEFYPYAVAIRIDGQTEMLAGRPDPADDHPAAPDVIAACAEQLRSRQTQLRAGAIVSDVRLPDLDGSDAIDIALEHAEGQALRVQLPYTRQQPGKDIGYGQLRAAPAGRQIWAHS